jgi:hypothetical protein
MSVTRWGFESGANGDALTAVNSGSDFFLTTGGTAALSTAQKMHGTQSALFTSTSTSGVLYLSKTIAATTQVGVDMYIYVTAPPSTEDGLIWVGDGATRGVSIGLTPTMFPRLRNGAAAGGTAIWTSGTAMSLNTWYRLSILTSYGTTTGTIRGAFYAGDSTTPLADSGTLTSQNAGATPYTTMRVGTKVGTGTVTMTAYIDDWAYDASAVSLLPPYGSTPPTLGTPAINYDLAHINMSGTTFPIGPGSYSVSPSTGTFVTNTGVLVPRDMSGNTISYQVTATDLGSGATATTSVSVTGKSSFVNGHTESRVWNGSAWI